GYTGKSVHFLGFQEMAKKFSNLLLTPDSYALTERLSQQPLFNTWGMLNKCKTYINQEIENLGVA
ncbi:MAG: hypothetical protein VKL60_03150, partial [Sphaerospermopsis sp.]|nr:hypothetical protein [Sphaerospermopsis sp.]